MLPTSSWDSGRSASSPVNWFTPASKAARRKMSVLKGHSKRSVLVKGIVLFLFGACVLMTLVTTRSWVHISITAPQSVGVNLRRMGRKELESARFFPAPQLDNLVLVAGHSVYTSLDFHQAALEQAWYLESYQKVPGEAQSFLKHIELGVQAAAADPKALLLFSGGQTRQDAGPRSEAASYWQVGEAMKWFNHTEVRKRAFTEEHARDSFENLLFGMCRFYELTGHYPQQVTIVSYSLKQARFKDVHRAAIRFPEEQFHFKGSEIPAGTKGAEEGEARTVAAFKTDPYSCTGTLLEKKLKRDPFAVGPPHPSRCPDMQELLTYCGSTTFTGYVPWEKSSSDEKSTESLLSVKMA